MAILISAHKLCKSFSSQVLFQELSLAIESGDRIGLIGPNGMGKSTLLKILSSQIVPDDGDLSLSSGVKIAMLDQSPSFQDQSTILQTLLLGVDPEDWDTQALARETFSRFNLQQFGEDTPMGELSGGWKKRVALARELIKEPDLLLLDEPTNHLDIEGIVWLENFLTRARFATITVTHDRLFLQRVTNQIIELDKRHSGGLLKVKGNYAKYLEVREQLISSQERREVILKNTLRRETQWLKQGAKARTTKQQARIDRAGELKTKVEDLTQRNLTQKAGFEFQSAGRNPKKLIEAEKVSKFYGEKTIFLDLDLKISPQSRIGLLGENGAGKSTLIRVLMGMEPPSRGKIFHSDQLEVAYFDQTREALNPELSVAQTLCPKGSHVDYCGKPVHIRSYLDRFLFDKQQAEMKVSKLSGGEQSRLLIARLMLNRANVLVLDEPTNDLDLATLSVLEECIKDFDGAVILVTHDRYFLDQVVDQLIAFPPAGSDKMNLLTFSDFMQWESWRTKYPQIKTSKAKLKTKKTQSQQPTQKKRLGFKEQREFDAMERTIQKAEDLLKQLTEESALPENTRNPKALSQITAKMSSAQIEIEKLYRRWEELEKKQS